MMNFLQISIFLEIDKPVENRFKTCTLIIMDPHHVALFFLTNVVLILIRLELISLKTSVFSHGKLMISQIWIDYLID